MGTIYKLVCIPSDKSYIGQTRDIKFKNGIQYSYGVTGRVNDHMTCKASTPLGQAISQYGSKSFSVESLESNIPDDRLDEREAYWINELNTLVPHGYNKMRHGRCRHRLNSSLALFYAPRTVGVKVRQIKQDGKPHLIYAYLTLQDNTEVRITFGQGNKSTYDTAVSESTKFLESFSDVPIDIDPHILHSEVSEYEHKIIQFDGTHIERIRIAKFNNLVAVYIKQKGTLQSRICFGGKTIHYDIAVEKALAFAQTLHNIHTESQLVNNS